MAQKLFTPAAVTISTAGTRVQIASSGSATSVTVIADPSNTGYVYVGDSTVSSTNGIPLAAGKDTEITSDDVSGSGQEVRLSDIYVDTQTNGNKVRIAYLAKR